MLQNNLSVLDFRNTIQKLSQLYDCSLNCIWENNFDMELVKYTLNIWFSMLENYKLLKWESCLLSDLYPLIRKVYDRYQDDKIKNITCKFEEDKQDQNYQEDNLSMYFFYNDFLDKSMGTKEITDLLDIISSKIVNTLYSVDEIHEKIYELLNEFDSDDPQKELCRIFLEQIYDVINTSSQ